MHCTVLQCGSELYSVVLHCTVLQCGSELLSLLQHITVQCSVEGNNDGAGVQWCGLLPLIITSPLVVHCLASWLNLV